MLGLKRGRQTFYYIACQKKIKKKISGSRRICRQRKVHRWICRRRNWRFRFNRVLFGDKKKKKNDQCLKYKNMSLWYCWLMEPIPNVFVRVYINRWIIMTLSSRSHGHRIWATTIRRWHLCRDFAGESKTREHWQDDCKSDKYNGTGVTVRHQPRMWSYGRIIVRTQEADVLVSGRPDAHAIMASRWFYICFEIKKIISKFTMRVVQSGLIECY